MSRRLLILALLLGPLAAAAGADAPPAHRVAYLTFIRLYGKVTDQHGEALGAVKISAEGQLPYGSTYTGEDGRYELHVEIDSSAISPYFSLRVEKDGYVPISQQLGADQDYRRVDFKLMPAPSPSPSATP